MANKLKEIKSIKKRTLYVKKVTPVELRGKWGIDTLPSNYLNKPIFIRCNSKGEVKWDKALVYHIGELRSQKNQNPRIRKYNLF